MNTPRSSTATLIANLLNATRDESQLVKDASIAAANRINNLRQIIFDCTDIVRARQIDEHLSRYPNYRSCSIDILMARIDAELES